MRLIASTSLWVVTTSLGVGLACDDPGRDGSPIRLWIADLGGEDYSTREKASTALADADLSAIPLLREAAGDSDPERARRARRLLDGPLRRKVLARLDGDWLFERIIENEVENPDGIGVVLEVRGRECRFIKKDGTQITDTETLRLDIAPNPIHVDLAVGESVTRGLLRLDGDALEITYGMTKNASRPTAIDPKRTKDLRYFLLERRTPPPDP